MAPSALRRSALWAGKACGWAVGTACINGSGLHNAEPFDGHKLQIGSPGAVNELGLVPKRCPYRHHEHNRVEECFDAKLCPLPETSFFPPSKARPTTRNGGTTECERARVPEKRSLRGSAHTSQLQCPAHSATTKTITDRYGEKKSKIESRPATRERNES